MVHSDSESSEFADSRFVLHDPRVATSRCFVISFFVPRISVHRDNVGFVHCCQLRVLIMNLAIPERKRACRDLWHDLNKSKAMPQHIVRKL